MPRQVGFGYWVPVAAMVMGLSGNAVAGFGDFIKSAGDYLQGPAAPTQSASSASATAGAGLSSVQIDAGLKQALSIGAKRAVALLGKQGGFLNDPSVRIPLPGLLDKVGQALRAAGQGRYVDQFEQAMNQAAEDAIPKTLGIVQNTVQNMTLTDARGILSGGNDAATEYLRQHAGKALSAAIEPIVARTTDSVGVTAAYKRMMSAYEGVGGSAALSGALGGIGKQLGGLGGLLGGNGSQQSLNLDQYITSRTLDGLFTKLAVEEKAIRQNPVQRSTELLKQVFSR